MYNAVADFVQLTNELKLKLSHEGAIISKLPQAEKNINTVKVERPRCHGALRVKSDCYFLDHQEDFSFGLELQSYCRCCNPLAPPVGAVYVVRVQRR